MTAYWKSPKLPVTAAVTKLYWLQQLHSSGQLHGQNGFSSIVDAPLGQLLLKALLECYSHVCGPGY